MAAIVLDGCQSELLKMGDTSLETCESSLDTSTSQTEAASDDEDDELLALRIAALESIKLKESKLASTKVPASQPKKPDFVIKSHPGRSNLLSIVTCEEEYEASHPPHKHSPPTVTPFFDPTRPPPGFARNSPPLQRRPSSRSPLPPSRRYSRSPRRYSSRSPQFRRRSNSPYGRRRRSFSRSPMRRSPLRRRSRSPPPLRRSPLPRRSPSPSEWETDTESEEESEEVKKEVKEEKPEVKESVKKPTVVKKLQNDDDPDASVDDVLKLDATDEVDEFSAFLNEFEDEVLAEKEASKENLEKKVKKERPETEKKTLDGKRLRKKLKAKTATPPPGGKLRSRSPGRKISVSPKWGMGAKTGGGRSPLGGRRSPGRRYFSPGRGRDGKLSPRRRNRTPSLSPESKRKRAQHKGSPISPESRSAKSRERSSKSKDKTGKESKPAESQAEREEREEKDYQEKLQKLPSKDRIILEARRKKFEKKVSINSTEPKKISLKSDKAETQTKRVDRFESKSEDELNADIGDTLDMFDDKQNSNGAVNENDPPVRKNVTDLRVQLHKKRQALGPSQVDTRTEKSSNPALAGKHPLLRSISPSPGQNSDGLDEDDFGPVSQSGRRKVVPPGKVPVKARLKISVENRSEEESDRSPSPPPKKLSKKRRRSGDSLESTGDLSGIGGRRILVVRKDISRDNSPEDVSATKVTSPRKGIKKSLHLRLGKKVEQAQAQFSENEIYAEMLRQQDEKRHSKKLKKEVKELKKREKLEKKGKKKSKKLKKTSLSNDEDVSENDIKNSLKRSVSPGAGADSDEELFRFFEDQEHSSDEKKRKKRNSGKGEESRSRRSSGEKQSRKKRSPGIKRRLGDSADAERVQRVSEDGGRIKLRLGKKVVGMNGDLDSRVVGIGGRRQSEEMLLDLEKFQGSTDEESLDILEKMKRKNDKRLRRMREIEQDKLMFA